MPNHSSKALLRQPNPLRGPRSSCSLVYRLLCLCLVQGLHGPLHNPGLPPLLLQGSLQVGITDLIQDSTEKRRTYMENQVVSSEDSDDVLKKAKDIRYHRKT